MRWMVPLCLVAAAAPAAAPQTSPQAADAAEVNRLLDEIRTLVRANEWNQAWRLSFLLQARLSRLASTRVSPDLELAHLEMLASKDSISRSPQLAAMAKAAYDARSFEKAERYANEALEAARHGVFWWTGDAIHQGHTVLGRLALQHGDLAAARQHLLASGRTPGSSSLGATGPSMALAQELLDRGESAAVLEYLEECRAFWGAHRGKLDEWTALVKAGLKPDFGPNLRY